MMFKEETVTIPPTIPTQIKRKNIQNKHQVRDWAGQEYNWLLSEYQDNIKGLCQKIHALFDVHDGSETISTIANSTRKPPYDMNKKDNAAIFSVEILIQFTETLSKDTSITTQELKDQFQWIRERAKKLEQYARLPVFVNFNQGAGGYTNFVMGTVMVGALLGIINHCNNNPVSVFDETCFPAKALEYGSAYASATWMLIRIGVGMFTGLGGAIVAAKQHYHWSYWSQGQIEPHQAVKLLLTELDSNVTFLEKNNNISPSQKKNT